MSFVSSLFGGSSTPTYSGPMVAQAPPPPAPLPAAPTISGADVAATGMESAARLRRRRGFDKTILGSALGDVGGASNLGRTTLLGGVGGAGGAGSGASTVGGGY